MSRSKAFRKFSKIVHRSWLMANLRNGLIENEILIGDGKLEDYDDLGRASIVLIVAAMDNYFTDAFVENLIPFLKNRKPTDELVSQLSNTGFTFKNALELLHEDDPYSRISEKFEIRLETHVTQNIEIIDKLFLAFGYKGFCKSAEGKSREKDVIHTFEEFVSRRHSIVHEGDYLENGELRAFEQNQITTQVQSLEKFIEACDEIIFP